jgi:hypothetical protein
MTQKLRLTVVAEWKVPKSHLKYYEESKTIQQAARSQQRNLDDGFISIEDLLGMDGTKIKSIKVQSVEE